MREIWLGTLALLIASPVVAQSEYGGGWTVNTLDVSSSISQDIITQEVYARNRLSTARSVARDAKPNRPRSAAAAAVQARSIAPLSRPLKFVSTPASMRAAQASYLLRLSKVHPREAKSLEEEFKRNDFSQVYAEIVCPFGLAPDDAADALAGYTVLCWLIATRAPDPSPAAVRAVRNLFAGRLAATPSFDSAGRRRALGEELKINFGALHAGWQSARREGTLKQYSDGVAQLLRKQGADLRQLRLTGQGLVGG